MFPAQTKKHQIGVKDIVASVFIDLDTASREHT
jgi:hypothetical protein